MFGTKAETLEHLRRHLTTAIIKPLVHFSVTEWNRDQPGILRRLQASLSGKQVAVRSASISEDCELESNAGRFQSVLGVSLDSIPNIVAAVNTVIASYDDYRRDHQVFVQEQVTEIKMSGVVLTRELGTLAPYYVINFDDLSGSTSSVTSGSSGELKTYLRFRGSPHRPDNHHLNQVLRCAEELESICQNDALDIEFALAQDEKLYLLQVRPIVRTQAVGERVEEILARGLERAADRIQILSAERPGLHGRQAVFSVMTDWNPAEMIGIRPRPLALSLYKELVTDSIWAYQRNNYGYRNLRSFPLLHSLLGIPYIDVRASFNSFIPGELDERLSAKLVDHYCNSLVDSPHDHDKVEFRIVFSCYYLNLSQKIKVLLSQGFSELELDRIKFALLNLTNNIIRQQDGHYKRDLLKVKQLESRHEEITQSAMPTLDKIYWLLEDCKRYGTLPFAGLARAGFIAVQFLRSFVDSGILTEDDAGRFMASLSTVANELTRDVRSYFGGTLGREELIERYGHLRPGTYDILSPRYDEAFDIYFKQGEQPIADPKPAPEFRLTDLQHRLISEALAQNGLLISTDELFTFLREAIEGREYSKFMFSRHVSSLLLLVDNLCSELGLAKDDASFIRIQRLVEIHTILSSTDLEHDLCSEIERNKREFAITNLTRLPQCITASKDLYEFYLGAVEPNFVTRGRVTQVVVVEELLLEADLSKKIVLIRSADPGFDWIFSRNIGGLITMYGGSNSHMAIRCAELKIPAVIGCGEANFNRWARCQMLDIDCANGLVRPIEQLPEAQLEDSSAFLS